MNSPFLVDDEKIRRLTATRQGRISISGFIYQAGYTVSRLASMHVRQPVLNLPDIPVVLRYDWAEDLDEVDDTGCTILTQCKRIDDVGQPSNLAKILLGFAPKWLWTPSDQRNQLCFRLVCSDPQFRSDGPVKPFVNYSKSYTSEVCAAAVTILEQPPSPYSDRSLWEDEGKLIGYRVLVESILKKTEVLYLNKEVLSRDPAEVPLLSAERAALDLLIRWKEIDPVLQKEALLALRSTLHGNLVDFNATSTTMLPSFNRSPRVLLRDDILASLFDLRPMKGRKTYFQVVGRRYIEEQAAKEKMQFVARPPDWADVVHGEDAKIHFIERDMTDELVCKVREHILNPIARGTDPRLRAVFLLGAPGSGKSTLVRRVAALLVQNGEVTVADPGVNLFELAETDVDPMITELARLGMSERPVLLILDDPFFTESGWNILMKSLGNRNQRIGVLGASPDFLFEKFGAGMRHKAIITETLTLRAPSPKERKTLAMMYGCVPNNLSRDEDDFLVLSMEAAAGEPFAEIIARIWTTLNDGQPINPFTAPNDLPWTVRSYLVACFFHRQYYFCPEAILREALTMGGSHAPQDYSYRLEQLMLSEGWRIFTVNKSPSNIARNEGRRIGAMHHRIAKEAWRTRPVQAFNVGNWVGPASIRTRLPYTVGALAGSMAKSDDTDDTSYADLLAKMWAERAETERIPTKVLAALVASLQSQGAQYAALISVMRQRTSLPDRESWLAILTLWYLSSLDMNKRTIPPEAKLEEHIMVADFSIAPARAIRFARIIKPHSNHYVAMMQRLIDALCGNLDWCLDGALLTWLLASSHKHDEIEKMLNHTGVWLKQNTEDTNVRAQFLRIVARFPVEHQMRTEFLENTAQWLRNHTEDTSVRTQFLSIVAGLPGEHQMHREFLESTVQWLRNHTEDTSVRTQFLSIVAGLPFEHQMCKEFLEGTAQWLRNHTEDTSVRTQFLSTVAGFPAEHRIRKEFLEDTAQWLRNHRNDKAVRANFLGVIAGVSTAELLLDCVSRTAIILDAQQGDLRWQSVACALAKTYMYAAQCVDMFQNASAIRESMPKIHSSLSQWFSSVGLPCPELESENPSRVPRIGTLGVIFSKAFKENAGKNSK